MKPAKIMAQPGTDKKKLKIDETELLDVKGFIHNVSPVKISEKNNSYFTCTLQTEKETNEVVCLCPEKHKYFQKAEREDSPIVVKNVRCQIENRKKKLFVNYLGSVSACEDVQFEKRVGLKEEVNVINITLEDICTKPVDVCAFYTVSGKIINVGKPTEVMIYGAKKICQTVVLTDGAHKINLSVYGQLLGQFDKGNAYMIENVALRNINNVKKLTVRKQTSIKKINFQLIGEMYDVGKNDDDKESFLIDIIGVKSELKINCPICLNTYDFSNIKHSITVRCKKCDMLTKTSKLHSATTTRLDGVDQKGQNHKFTIFDSIMKDMLSKIKKAHLLQDCKGLEEYLIQQSAKLLIITDTNTVKEISFDNDEA